MDYKPNCVFCNKIEINNSSQTKHCRYLSYEFGGYYCEDCLDVAMKVYEFARNCNIDISSTLYPKLCKSISKFHCDFKISKNCRNCDLKFFCYTR